MKKLDLNNDHDIDFISIHCCPDNYGGAGMADWFFQPRERLHILPDFPDLCKPLDWTWNTYHKPIWITEFSTTGASITATGGNGTKEFWERVMPGLDSREYVERYAAFDFNLLVISPSIALSPSLFALLADVAVAVTPSALT